MQPVLSSPLVKPVDFLNPEDVKKFKQEITTALKEYIKVSCDYIKTSSSYSLREPGKLTQAFNKLVELAKRGETPHGLTSLEAASLPIYRFMVELITPYQRFFIPGGDHKFLSSLIHPKLLADSNWLIEGFIVLDKKCTSNDPLNVFAAWCIHGEMTPEIVALFEKADIAVRFHQTKGEDVIEIQQLNIYSFYLLTAALLGDVRRVLNSEEKILQACQSCKIFDYTLPQGVGRVGEPLAVFCERSTNLVNQLEEYYFDTTLYQVLLYLINDKEYKLAEDRGTEGVFFEKLFTKILQRGSIFDFELALCQKAPPNLQTAMVMMQPLTPSANFNFLKYRKLMEKPRQDKIEEAPFVEKENLLKYKLEVNHCPQPLLSQVPSKIPFEQRVINRLRCYVQFANEFTRVLEDTFYETHEPRLLGLESLIESLHNELEQGEACDPVVAECLQIAALEIEAPEPETVPAYKLRHIFEGIQGDFIIDTYLEKIGQGYFVEAPCFRWFAKLCLSRQDVSSVLFSLFDLSSELQCFRLRARNPETGENYDLLHLNCISYYMLSRDQDHPYDPAVFENPATREQRVKLLSMPIYYDTPQRKMWINPVAVIHHRACRKKLPLQPWLLDVLPILIDEQKKNPQIEMFKRLPSMELGKLIDLRDGESMRKFTQSTTLVDPSFALMTSMPLNRPSTEGLINIGDSCWMNSTLQALARTSFILHPSLKAASSENSHALLKTAFLDVLTHVKKGIDPSLMQCKLEHLRRQLYESGVNAEFAFGNAQMGQKEQIMCQRHDPAIFLEALLNLYKIQVGYKQTVLGKNDKGEITYQSQNNDILSLLRVQLGPSTLQEALDKYFTNEPQGEVRQLGQLFYTRFKETIRLREIPNMFVLQVYRFKSDPVKGPVYLPGALGFSADEVLDLTPYLDEGIPGEAHYRLVSCIHHHPGVLPHFTATVNEEGSWNYYDDSHPKETRGPIGVQSSHAYLMFFERILP